MARLVPLLSSYMFCRLANECCSCKDQHTSSTLDNCLMSVTAMHKSKQQALVGVTTRYASLGYCKMHSQNTTIINSWHRRAPEECPGHGEPWVCQQAAAGEADLTLGQCCAELYHGADCYSGQHKMGLQPHCCCLQLQKIEPCNATVPSKTVSSRTTVVATSCTTVQHWFLLCDQYNQQLLPVFSSRLLVMRRQTSGSIREERGEMTTQVG